MIIFYFEWIWTWDSEVSWWSLTLNIDRVQLKAKSTTVNERWKYFWWKALTCDYYLQKAVQQQVTAHSTRLTTNIKREKDQDLFLDLLLLTNSHHMWFDLLRFDLCAYRINRNFEFSARKLNQLAIIATSQVNLVILRRQHNGNSFELYSFSFYQNCFVLAHSPKMLTIWMRVFDFSGKYSARPTYLFSRFQIRMGYLVESNRSIWIAYSHTRHESNEFHHHITEMHSTLSVNAFAADACVFNWSQCGECFSFFNLYEIVSKFRFELSQSERRAIWL